MISIAGYAIIYLGGIAFLYIRFFYHDCCSPSNTIINDEIDGQTNVSYPVFEDQENYRPIFEDDEDSLDEEESEEEADDNESFSWEFETFQVPTLRKSLVKDEAQSPPRPKFVNFSLMSDVHSTFSSDKYKRKNKKWFKKFKTLHENREKLTEINSKLKLFKSREMKTYKKPSEKEKDGNV